MGASSRWRLFMWYVSFERSDAERTLAHRWGGCRRFDSRRGFSNRWLGLIFGHVLQKCRRRHKEQVSGHGAAEVQQPVVVAGRPANEHVLDHLFDSAGRTAVADEIGAKLTMRGPAERHVVAQDLDLFPVLDDCGERVVCRGWLDRIVQFDIGKLGAADDAFLRFGGERIPCAQIVEILLNDDITAGSKRRAFVADEDGIGYGGAAGILRAIDEPQEIALVEVTKAVHLIHWRNCISQTPHNLSGQLKAQIHLPGADVEQQVAWCGDRMARPSTNLTKGMQFCRPGLPEEAVPCV